MFDAPRNASSPEQGITHTHSLSLSLSLSLSHARALSLSQVTSVKRAADGTFTLDVNVAAEPKVSTQAERGSAQGGCMACFPKILSSRTQSSDQEIRQQSGAQTGTLGGVSAGSPLQSSSFRIRDTAANTAGHSKLVTQEPGAKIPHLALRFVFSSMAEVCARVKRDLCV